MYKVYILKCSDKTLYTGISNNLEKRIKQHNGEILGGAKYTSGRNPIKLVYFENAENKSEASKREIKIKKLRKSEKIKLINKFKNLNI